MIKLFLFAILCRETIKASPLYSSQNFFGKTFYPDPLQASASNTLPMVHNNNFDMIMPDYYDSHPAASMEYQNFDKFYDPQMQENAEMKMDESQFLQNTPVRDPQPLSAEERRIRKKLEYVDEKRERKMQLKLKKGSTVPSGGNSRWEQFDYDLYSVNPGDDKHYVGF